MWKETIGNGLIGVAVMFLLLLWSSEVCGRGVDDETWAEVSHWESKGESDERRDFDIDLKRNVESERESEKLGDRESEKKEEMESVGVKARARSEERDRQRAR